MMQILEDGRYWPIGFIGRGPMYASVLDKVFVEVTEELGKDKDLVARFKQMTLEKVETFLPEAAGKTAESICQRAKEEASYNRSELTTEVTKRITAYFQTPEGSARMDAAIAKAIDATLEGDAVSKVVDHYVGQRIGILARDAVIQAIESEKRKADRKAKKAAKTAAGATA
jgi:hypothetical protein